MSIFGSGGGPGNRLSFTEGGHMQASPQVRRDGVLEGARGVRARPFSEAGRWVRGVG